MRGRAPSVYTGGNIVLIAQAYGAMGDVEKMMPWLRKLLAEPSALPFTPASIKIDPRFARVITHPALQALLAEFAHLDAKKSAAVGAADPKAIAVLPFENLSGEPDSAGFADGMHEEVLTAVAKVAALTVIGRTSVLPYRDAAKRNLRTISTELAVGTVVEGTVRRAGNRVRIAVKLVDTQTSRQLWSDSFEHELTDVFAIQVAVAEKIAATLKATFTAGERASLERRPTENTRAYELYLQAKLLNNDLNNTTPFKEWERAVKLLEQAIAADPGFAQAYGLLARTHASSSWHGTLDPSPARRELARQALANAQRLAPTAAETRFAEGRFIYTSNRDFAVAMTSYEAALTELPNDSALLYHIGLTQRQLGRLTEAVATLTRAHQLNPLDISNAGDLINSLLMMRRFADGLRIGERYTGRSTTLRTIIRSTTSARYELDGDKALLLSAIGSAPTWGNDPADLFPRNQAAYYGGNLAEAARLLGDARLVTIPNLSNSISEPIALHRAMVALLLARREEAATLAVEAIAFLRAGSWTKRQEPAIALALARATGYAGRNADAIKLATDLQRELGEKKGGDEVYHLDEIGRLYALLGAREQALACLRSLMTGPSSPYFGLPRMVRLDPCWSRLAEDPRFEEILKAAKAL